jgi:hypothetical protein
MPARVFKAVLSMALCTVRQQHKTALRLNYNCFSQNNFFGKKPASTVKAVFALALWAE